MELTNNGAPPHHHPGEGELTNGAPPPPHPHPEGVKFEFQTLPVRKSLTQFLSLEKFN